MEKTIWGPGVPSFMPSDMLTGDELRDMGVMAALSLFNSGSFELINAQSAPNVWPNIVSKKDGRLWFIAVATAVAPQYGTLEQDEKDNLVSHAEKFDAVAAVVGVSVGSIDAERFEMSVALRGDKYQYSVSPIELLRQ